MERIFAFLGSIFAGLGVGLGAFGAHALRSSLSARDLEIFETAVRYQLVHALALWAIAWAVSRWPDAGFAPAGWLMSAGILIFSGSLYLLVLTGTRQWGAVTPLGGVALILAWGWMAWTLFRLPQG